MGKIDVTEIRTVVEVEHDYRANDYLNAGWVLLDTAVNPDKEYFTTVYFMGSPVLNAPEPPEPPDDL